MNSCIKYFLILSLLTLLLSCVEQEDNLPVKSTLFEEMTNAEIGVDFINKIEETEEFNILSYRNFYNGGGVALGDINNDNLLDLFFTSNLNENRLYLNQGNWKFKDITETAGISGSKFWSTGVTMVDINGDGWLDIYVCNSGSLDGKVMENELYINQGNATFVESAYDYGLDVSGYSTHASFFDYDMDGDLDCYVLNNSFKDTGKITQYGRDRNKRDTDGGDKLLKNEKGVFIDVSEEAGIYSSSMGFGLGVSVSDLNGDMFPDIYVSNDFWERDYLYINKGDGTFEEQIASSMSTISMSSMGADIADLDNNATPEVFTTDMLPADSYRLKAMTNFDEFHLDDYKVSSNYHYQILQNSLHYNDGNANFQELAHFSGVAATDWSWGALVLDFDNDGWKDIFVSNGINKDITFHDFTDYVADKTNVRKLIEDRGKFDIRDVTKFFPSTPIANYAFVNNRNKTFSSVAWELGLDKPSFSNGAAYGDLDNDGDLDLVINNVNMPCFIYQNRANEQTVNSYLKVRFNGEGANIDGIGSKVRIYIGASIQELQYFPSRGFQSSTSDGLLFGLGKEKTIDSLIVIWPNRKVQKLTKVAVDQELVLKLDDAKIDYVKKNKIETSIYKDATNKMIVGNHQHIENKFVDFDRERLMPRMLSTEGPKIIKGDINGDSKEDFILLGARNDEDKIFIQKKNGQFERVSSGVLSSDKLFESTCGVLVDIDADNDLDLLIGSGGNDTDVSQTHYRIRFYENDGNGNFSKNENKTPNIGGNFSCIVPADYDNDGAMDLFIGGRCVPGNYGANPESYLIEYRNGVWDITHTPNDLKNIGMVTNAAWSDYDNDSRLDLIVIGDWMPIVIFKNEGIELQKTIPVEGSNGWWTALYVSDLDNDGDDDYVLGNWGLNTKFKATKEQPVTMYVNDFDSNGKSDLILNWHAPLDEQAFPFASKKDLTAQIPSLKKRALKYDDFAKLNYEALFDEKARANASSYDVNYLQSAVLWNEDGNLKLEPLPAAAQVAPVFGIIAEDLDEDGNKDILLTGNFYGLKPEVGRHDANRGVWFKVEKDRSLSLVPSNETGVFVTGEVRDMKLFGSLDKRIIIVSRNNDDISTFVSSK